MILTSHGKLNSSHSDRQASSKKLTEKGDASRARARLGQPQSYVKKKKQLLMCSVAGSFQSFYVLYQLNIGAPNTYVKNRFSMRRSLRNIQPRTDTPNHRFIHDAYFHGGPSDGAKAKVDI